MSFDFWFKFHRILFLQPWKSPADQYSDVFWCLFPLLLHNSENIHTKYMEYTCEHTDSSPCQSLHYSLSPDFVKPKPLPELMLIKNHVRHHQKAIHRYVTKLIEAEWWINLTIIGSDNGLSPGRSQAIIWTNTGILLIMETNFSEIFIKIHTFSFKKLHLKMSSGKCRPFWLGHNVLRLGQERHN